MITRVALAAEAGDDVAVGSAIMTGLLTEGVASIGAVAAVGVEFAALGALTYGAEKVYKAAEGIVERPRLLGRSSSRNNRTRNGLFSIGR